MIRLRVLASVLVLAAFLAAPLGAAAAKPDMERIEIADIGILDDVFTPACGFDVWFDGTGHIIVRSLFDKAGNYVGNVDNYGIRVRYYSAYGEISVVDTGVDRFIDNGDGSLTHYIIGNVQSISVPGQGRVYISVGQIVETITFDANGDPIFEFLYSKGQHSEDQVEVLCGLLGPQ